MERARDELFAGAALAGDEDGGRRVGDALEDRVDAQDGFALADDPEASAGTFAGLFASRLGVGQIARAQRLLDDGAHLGLVEGLGDVVEGPGFQRLDRVVDRAVGREHHDRKLGVDAQRLPEKLHPVHLRHAKVGDDQIDVVLAKQREARLAVLGGVDFVAVAGELRGEDPSQVRLRRRRRGFAFVRGASWGAGSCETFYEIEPVWSTVDVTMVRGGRFTTKSRRVGMRLPLRTWVFSGDHLTRLDGSLGGGNQDLVPLLYHGPDRSRSQGRSRGICCRPGFVQRGRLCDGHPLLERRLSARLYGARAAPQLGARVRAERGSPRSGERTRDFSAAQARRG